MSTRLGLAAYLLIAALAFGCRGNDAPDSLSASSVTIIQDETSHTVSVEIASTVTQRQQGLMFRQELAEEAGMLFLFAEDVRIGFWMRNTYVPLDIAYIGVDGRVQEIRQAKPLDETVLTPTDPYRYVVEVNQGWFQRHGLGVGAMVKLPDGLPTPE